MRVWLSTIGSRGDVQPLVALASQLRALGQEVRLCVPPDFRDWIESLGMPVIPIGPEVRAFAAARPPAMAAPPSAESIRQISNHEGSKSRRSRKTRSFFVPFDLFAIFVVKARPAIIRSMRTALVFVGLAVTLSAQAPRPSFEVASIKNVDRPGSIPPAKGSPLDFYRPAATVASLIQFAYDIRDFELIGGPDWMRRDQFEVRARAAAAVSDNEKRPMVQSLLEDRFKLVIRRERQEMRFSALVLARRDGRVGPKLTACRTPEGPSTPVRYPRGGNLATGRCAPVSQIARTVAVTLRMPIVDKTGLTGMWSYELAYLDPSAREPEPQLTAFTTALEEQLGLKLESARGPVDVLVVESVQQPTPD